MCGRHEYFSFLFLFFLLSTFFRTAIKACTLCAHQWRRCSPTKDGSREEDEDDEVEEVRSPRKRKRASTDKGSRDKKGKRKMTEADWEVELRWRDQVEARLESMDSVLRKIAGCLEGIGEMIEDRWFVKETVIGHENAHARMSAFLAIISAIFTKLLQLKCT